MMFLRKLIIPLLTIILLSASCTILAWKPKPIHSWLIGKENCQPPCWNGIIPGETTFEQALDIVQDFDFISDEGHINVGDDESYINWYSGDRNNIYLRFYESKIIFIELYTLIGDLGSVVNHFGEPDGYTKYFDESVFDMQVFYPDYGLVFETNTFRGGNLISENNPVRGVYYFEPAEPNVFPINFYNAQKIYAPNDKWFDYYEWEGFGVNLSEND